MNAPQAITAITIAAIAAYRLEVLPGEFTGTWDKAVAWAKEQGGELPTRIEQIHLFNELRTEFEHDWYWSGEQHAGAAAYAWCQDFGDGYQYWGHKGNEFRARAVRRVPI